MEKTLAWARWRFLFFSRDFFLLRFTVSKRTREICLLAEGVGFEPTVRYNRTPDFESGAFDLSATLPI